MERRKRARMRHQEEVLAAHLAELKVDLGSKDAHAAAKLGRLVMSWAAESCYHEEGGGQQLWSAA